MSKFEYSYTNDFNSRSICNWNQVEDGRWVGDSEAQQIQVLSNHDKSINITIAVDAYTSLTDRIPLQVIIDMLNKQGYTVNDKG